MYDELKQMQKRIQIKLLTVQKFKKKAENIILPDIKQTNKLEHKKSIFNFIKFFIKKNYYINKSKKSYVLNLRNSNIINKQKNPFAKNKIISNAFSPLYNKSIRHFIHKMYDKNKKVYKKRKQLIKKIKIQNKKFNGNSKNYTLKYKASFKKYTFKSQKDVHGYKILSKKNCNSLNQKTTYLLKLKNYKLLKQMMFKKIKHILTNKYNGAFYKRSMKKHSHRNFHIHDLTIDYKKIINIIFLRLIYLSRILFKQHYTLVYRHFLKKSWDYY